MVQHQQWKFALLLPVLIFMLGSLAIAQANQVSSFTLGGSVVGYTTQYATGTIQVNRQGTGAIFVEFAVSGPLYGFECAYTGSGGGYGCYVPDGSNQTTVKFWGSLVASETPVNITARNPNAQDLGMEASFSVTPPQLNLSLSAGELGSGQVGTGTVTTTPALRQSVTVHIWPSGPGLSNLNPPYEVGALSNNTFTYTAASVTQVTMLTIGAEIEAVPKITTSAALTVDPTQEATSDTPSETAPGCCNEPTASQPISLSSGNTYIVQSDLAIPGLGGGLKLQRVWNSMWPASQAGTEVGMFGRNWRSNFEERVFVGRDGTVKYARGDGSFWSFGYDPSTGARPLIAPAEVQATISAGASYWTLTFKSGEKRLFANTSGSLIDIIDRNGNTSQLSYDGMNRLIAVTDAASRHLYFSYPDNSTYQATAVTSDFGMSLSYTYDGQQRLTSVTKPDSTTISFDYNAQSQITAVRDSAGKILESHTYDSLGRGLTGSRANGVEGVTVSYPQ